MFTCLLVHIIPKVLEMEVNYQTSSFLRMGRLIYGYAMHPFLLESVLTVDWVSRNAEDLAEEGSMLTCCKPPADLLGW